MAGRRITRLICIQIFYFSAYGKFPVYLVPLGIINTCKPRSPFLIRSFFAFRADCFVLKYFFFMTLI